CARRKMRRLRRERTVSRQRSSLLREPRERHPAETAGERLENVATSKERSDGTAEAGVVVHGSAAPLNFRLWQKLHCAEILLLLFLLTFLFLLLICPRKSELMD